MLGKVVLPTCATEPFGHAFARIVPAIDRLCTGHGLCGMPDGIGIGCTGPVDVRRGLVRNPYTLPGWPDAPLVEAFASRYGCPVRLENDADTALIGELVSREECRKVKNDLMLTFGTGVGSAVLRSGAILRGEDFSHPELGHLLVSEAVSSCYCGGSGMSRVACVGTCVARSGTGARVCVPRRGVHPSFGRSQVAVGRSVGASCDSRVVGIGRDPLSRGGPVRRRRRRLPVSSCQGHHHTGSFLWSVPPSDACKEGDARKRCRDGRSRRIGLRFVPVLLIRTVRDYQFAYLHSVCRIVRKNFHGFRFSHFVACCSEIL